MLLPGFRTKMHRVNELEAFDDSSSDSSAVEKVLETGKMRHEEIAVAK